MFVSFENFIIVTKIDKLKFYSILKSINIEKKQNFTKKEFKLIMSFLYKSENFKLKISDYKRIFLLNTVETKQILTLEEKIRKMKNERIHPSNY